MNAQKKFKTEVIKATKEQFGIVLNSLLGDEYGFTTSVKNEQDAATLAVSWSKIWQVEVKRNRRNTMFLISVTYA